MHALGRRIVIVNQTSKSKKLRYDFSYIMTAKLPSLVAHLLTSASLNIMGTASVVFLVWRVI